VIFLNYRAAYFFPRLFFVSPSSYHPFVKCPQGVAFLRDHFLAQATRLAINAGDPANAAGGKRLFVTRRALWRNVVNLDEVIASFLAFDFEIVELERLSFVEQVRTFSQAEVVVGVMGAGMANVVFSPEGAVIVYLAPEGWKDPFFWDLAGEETPLFRRVRRPVGAASTVIYFVSH
jgi:capsular polysaccharide biosynthesis protein